MQPNLAHLLQKIPMYDTRMPVLLEYTKPPTSHVLAKYANL